MLNSEGDPTYRPSSANGSFVSSASEVNQTSEHQHETIEETNEEGPIKEQEEIRAPLYDVQEGEEEEATDVVVGTEREGMLEGENKNEEIPEADGRENSTEGAQNPANIEVDHVQT